MVLDMFREHYVNISGEMLDMPEAVCIFSIRRGKYVFWVGVIEPEIKKDEPNVVEVAYYRFAIIELGEDDDGDVVVKDYMFFDLDAPDTMELVNRLRVANEKMFLREIEMFGVRLEKKKKQRRRKVIDDELKMFG